MKKSKLREIAALLFSLYLALFITACGNSGSSNNSEDPAQYTITAKAEARGSISPSGVIIAENGSNRMFTMTPDSGYIVSNVLVDGESVGAVTSYSFDNITAAHTIEAVFTNEPHTITAMAGANGSISPSGDVSVDPGTDQAFTIISDTNYYVSDVLVDGVSVGAVENYTFTNVSNEHTIEAIFDTGQPTITASTGANGSISPSGDVSVDPGADQEFTITPDANGYFILDVLVDGESVGAVTRYTFSNVTKDHTIEASFDSGPHTITATAGANGSISPSGAVKLIDGTDQAFTIISDTNYYVSDVLVDGVSAGAVTSYLFNNVTADHTIIASFATGPRTIIATSGVNGSISPSDDVSVDPGTDEEFAIIPDGNYYVSDVLVNGESVGAVTNYTFANVTTDHTIEASFATGPRTITATAGVNGSISPFGDVSVEAGADQEFIITPDTGYYVSDVLVDGVSVGAAKSYSFNNITAAHTIEAVFTNEPRTITATAGANGNISPSGDVYVEHGVDEEFTIIPDGNYYVSDVLVDGESVGAVTKYTFANVTADHTIKANFATNTITATAGANGSISPSGEVIADNGSNKMFTMIPDSGYIVSDVLVNGESVGAVTNYTFANVTTDHTIEARFATGPRTITATVGANGSISPSGDVSVEHGTDEEFTIIPDGNYYVSDVLVDGVSVGAVTSYTFTNVTTDHTIEVSFATNTITATAGANGSISPSGEVIADNGSNKMFTMIPDSGYIVSDVQVDGVSVGAVTSYSFNNITAAHTIEVVFTNEPRTITVTAGDNGIISPAGDVSVDAGTDQTFTITPDTDYYVSDVIVDGVSVGVVTSYSFINVTADRTIEASFDTGPRTITASAGVNGSISPSAEVSVDPGTDQEFIITPDVNGYFILDVLVDGESVGAVTRYTFSNVTKDHTIEAVFTNEPRTITAMAGANGSILPSGEVSVEAGTDQTFTITPDVGYYVTDVLVDGVSVGAVTIYTFNNVTTDHTITTSFASGPRTITATAEVNGSISPSGDVSVEAGTDQEFTIIPDGNYYVSDVLVDGVSVGAIENYTFPDVTKDHTIEASFTTNTITATAGTNGIISPSGLIAVNDGADQTFTITADTNYHISDVLVDGVSVGAVTSYPFTNVTSDHTIEANFETDHIFVTIGDSITKGTGDDDSSDDTSQDGVNTGGGYQPILNDLLTDHENDIPHNIINEGVGGDTSSDGLTILQSILNTYPEALSYLVMFGTNDARPWLPVPSGKGLNPGDSGYPGTYKDNMQQIIDAINNAGKEVLLAKPPITVGDSVNSTPNPDPDGGARSVLIKEYNQVIDELVNDPLNNISVTPPDFYNYFKSIDPATGTPRYADQYADNLHPNGIGYQSMAEVWFNALTQ